MLTPTDNFLNWYKSCCDLDLGLYRTVNYKKNKAKIIFSTLSNFDFVLYPLNGSQKVFYGSKSLCELYIQENLNIKFLIFSLKDDVEKNYSIYNENVKII